MGVLHLCLHLFLSLMSGLHVLLSLISISSAEGVEKKVRKSQRGVGGRGTKDRMGISHHAPNLYYGDAFQFGVRVGRDDSGRNT